MTAEGKLADGRAAGTLGAWEDVYDSLTTADQESPLGGEDLELLATSAYLTARDREFHKFLERAYHAHLESNDRRRAARCAFWLGLTSLFRGESAQGSGWLARAQSTLEGDACAEQGYLLLPAVEQQLGEGDARAAHATATLALEIGQRFGDQDLLACARHLQGRALLQEQQVQAGLRLLDEAMLAASAGELSPIMTGLVYCSVIDACQKVYALSRARQWTLALTAWCEKQPQMSAFYGTCLVHRAEIMQLGGTWSDAMAETCRACERLTGSGNRAPSALALYQQAELHRLCGEFEAAEEAYRSASRLGLEPQPGLALLRMAQGRTDAAGAALSRLVSTATDLLQRARLLPAHIEIALAANDVQEARSACSELEQIAEKFDTDMLRAMAAQARGTVELAEGNARVALGPLRRAFEAWQEVEVPYEAARVRVLLGKACRLLGDFDAAELELDAAREIFEELGAQTELSRLEPLEKHATAPREHPLSARELEVLRLIVVGKTNKAIASELFVSERTIDRHVSNILTKLGVPSRAAAAAWAVTKKLG